jgi:hypothetical protein
MSSGMGLFSLLQALPRAEPRRGKPYQAKKVPEQRGLPFSGSTWQTAAYRTQRPDRHCCRSKGAATPRVNGLLRGGSYPPLARAFCWGTGCVRFSSLGGHLLPVAGATSSNASLRGSLRQGHPPPLGLGLSGFPNNHSYYTISMTALSRGRSRVFENSSSTHQTTITQPPQPTHNKKIPPPPTRRYCTLFHNTN